MAGETRREPKYTAIAADLAARIGSGEFGSGQALPAQRDLSARYGVTLMTLRQALRLLTDRGLITQHPGRGTFVAPAKAAYRMGTLRSLSDDLREQGHDVGTVLIGRTQRRPPRPVAEQLRLDSAQPALRIERLRLLGGTPAIHQVSWVPETFAGPVRTADLAATSLYGALAAGGVAVLRAHERLSPAVLDARLAGRLERPAGTPVFVSDRLTLGVDDAPVVFDRATILGEFIEIRTDRAPASVSVQWATASPGPGDH